MTLRSLLEHIAWDDLQGDADRELTTIVPLDPANQRPDVLSWCNEKNRDQLPRVSAGAVICPVSARGMELSATCTFIFCADPRGAYRDAFNVMFPRKERVPFISPTAIIAATARIGERASIGHHVVIEDGCTVGDDCSIGHHTVLHERTVLGGQVTIGCNCTIGGMGFGYQPNASGDHERMPHMGNVVIDDGVEIGNSTCIDRAGLGSTRIRRNVKIDNLVHIAHNADIGENSLVIANAMVAGSCEVGPNAWIAPSASILNKRKVGAKAVVGMGAVVVKDVEAGSTVAGNPARALPPK